MRDNFLKKEYTLFLYYRYGTSSFFPFLALSTIVAYRQAQISRATGHIYSRRITELQHQSQNFQSLRLLLLLLPPSSCFETMSLPNLPTEIKRMILKTLVKDGRELARCAAVSREWQAVIEPLTFKRIKVTPSRIAELDGMTRRNRCHVKYLWLCLELGRYDCDTCSHDGDVPMFNTVADDALVQTATQSFFLVLGAWDRSSSLTLDISVYSTSDAEHWFKYLTFEPDDDEDDVSRSDQALARQVDDDDDDDARHRWDTSGWDVTAAQSAVQNVFTRTLGDPLGEFEDEPMGILGWWRELPLVPAVTRLLLRQQTRRRWDPQAIVEMLALFPRLRELHFEPWREWDNILQRRTDGGETAFTISWVHL